MNDFQRSISQSISWLRFPLIVMVVYIHSRAEIMHAGYTEHYFMLDGITYYISNIICSIAVPVFFVISGYLFFFKGCFSMEEYKRKIVKRAKSLLFPYIVWNAIVLLCYYAIQSLAPDMTSGNQKLIADYSMKDFLSAFWDGNKGVPICYQFWFLRDLMVVIVLSPFVFKIIVVLKDLFLPVVTSLWFFLDYVLCKDLFVDLRIEAFFFFSIGAYIAIEKAVPKRLERSQLILCSIVYLLFSALEIYLYTKQFELFWGQIFLHKITKLYGTFLLIFLVYVFSDHLNITKRLENSSFFVYAFHGLCLTFLVKLSIKILCPQSEWMVLALYIFIPVLVVTLGVVIYSLLNKSSFFVIILGGRV